MVKIKKIKVTGYVPYTREQIVGFLYKGLEIQRLVLQMFKEEHGDPEGNFESVLIRVKHQIQGSEEWDTFAEFKWLGDKFTYTDYQLRKGWCLPAKTEEDIQQSFERTAICLEALSKEEIIKIVPVGEGK